MLTYFKIKGDLLYYIKKVKKIIKEMLVVDIFILKK